MKIPIIFTLLFIITASVLKSQIILKVEINNLRNNKGTVLFDFRDGNDKRIKGFSQEIKNNKCIIIFKNLKAGKYAFKYFHDENENKEIDTYWIGAPKEGYGFSNNARGMFGPPSFEKTVFYLNENKTLHCTPRYISFY